MNTYEKIKRVCTQCNKAFETIEPFILDWKSTNTQVKKTKQKLNALDKEGRYPPDYGHFSASTYLYSQVLTDRGAIKSLLVQKGPFLTSMAKEVLAFWGDHPGFWCFFAIEKLLDEEGFLTIVDLFSLKPHLVYSPALCNMQQNSKTRDKHYLCLLLFNGECLQTAGMLHYYSLAARDLRFYCNVFGDSGFDSEESLDAIIKAHYISFFKLDMISSLPVPMHKEHELRKCWQPFSLKGFDPSRLEGTWITVELDGQQKFYFNEPTESIRTIPNSELLFNELPMMGGTLVREKDSSQMALITNSEVSYAVFAALLNQSFPDLQLPATPAVSVTFALVELLEMGGHPVPWKQFTKILEFRPSKREEDQIEEMSDDEADEMVRALFQRYRENHGLEKPSHEEEKEDKEGSTQALLESEDEEIFINSFHKPLQNLIASYEVKEEDRSIEFIDCPNPSFQTRMLFFSHFIDGEVFRIADDEQALLFSAIFTNGSYYDKSKETGMAPFIEKLFLNYFPSDKDLPYLLLNSFFWVLFHKGNEWAPMRSYAIEMLKHFPTPIIHAYPESEDFIKAFSRFTKRILAPRGICSLKTRPTASEITTGMYAIKGSPIFYSLVDSVLAL